MGGRGGYTMSDWLEAERRMERAQRLCESQRWEEALTEVDAAVSINPNNAHWHAQRGFLLQELDRDEEAVEAYESSMALEPGEPHVAVALGLVLVRLGKLPRALQVFEALSKRFPDFEPSYCHRIHIYAQLGQFDRAEEMFYLAQQIDEKCPTCFVNIGDVLRAKKKPSKAMYCWQQALALQPDYPGVHWRMADVYREQRNIEKARRHYTLEHRNDPGNTGLLSDLAELAMESGDLDSAAAKFEQIVDLEPDHAEAVFSLGKVRLLQGRTEEAIRHFQSAWSIVGADPEELPEFSYLMGQALCRLERYSEAVSHLENACKHDAANSSAQLLLADCLLVSERLPDAVDGYRRLLALDADNLVARRKLSVGLLKLGLPEGSLEHALFVLERDPNDRTAAFNASVAYLMLGRWREARTVLDGILKIHKDDAALWALRSVIWRFRIRRIARAILRHVPFLGWGEKTSAG